MNDPLNSYPLTQIYFYLTSGCNLKCRHCWISPGYLPETAESGKTGRHLDIDLFRSILRQAGDIGTDRIKLTGGEPLLHPGIEEILEIARSGGFRINIETNGTICTPSLAKRIADCNDPFVSVSLDGAERETHDWVRGVPGSFDRALSGIRALVNAGIGPQLIMTLLKTNRDQIESYIRMAEDLGAASVKLNVLQAMAGGKRLYRDGAAPGIRELLEIGKWVEGPLAESARIPVFYHHPPAFRPLGRMLGADGDGCSSCGILGIIGVLADGSYALCGIGESIPEMVLGHAADTRLEEVWREAPLLSEIRKGLPHRLEGICSDCLMKAQCLGNCLAHNYSRGRNLWAPFWYCEAAAGIGEFPLSRLRPGTSAGNA